MSDFSSNNMPDSRPKMLLLIIISSVLFLVYSYYLFSLQMLHGVEFQKRAVNASSQIQKIPSQRGEIYDRNFNMPLVLNVDVFTVTIVPAEIPKDMRDTVFQRLALVLDESVTEINKKVPKEYYSSFIPITLSSSVNLDVVTKIAERTDDFPGVSWYSRPKRNYLESGSFSHIIGYVGDITRDELKINYNKGYQSGDIVGKAGIERQYDELLRGKDGRQFKTIDAKGRNVNIESRNVEPPQMGKNLVLTIDRSTQILAEKALGNRVGSIVILKPATGEILAMASYPSFNANSIVDKGGNNVYAKLLADKNAPLINRTIQSSYPPASTFKTIMSTAILEEKVFPPDEKIRCLGEIEYGDRIFRCHIKKPGHGSLDLANALAQSCDVYFWEVGRDKLGIERIVTYAREFGFGQITGIDLPGEVAGFVPTPQWKERTFHDKWLGGDTLNTSIGQGFLLASPLQVANMIALVVNEGVIYKPHLLKEVRDPRDGSIIKSITPEVHISSSISKETFREVKKNLRGVIEYGTARYAVNTKATKVGGKTGTAEVGSDDHWHSWFAGFGPSDASPEDMIVTAVIVEAVNQWEWWAVHATNIIYEAYFRGISYEEAATKLGLLGHTKTVSSRME